jgi:hypothetical protein
MIGILLYVPLAIFRFLVTLLSGKKCSSQWSIPILPRKVNSVSYQFINIVGRIGIYNKTQKLT